MNSSSLSHCKWKCQYHIVFIPKYRVSQLVGDLKGKSALMIYDKHPEKFSK
jgi:REP element-mobilizing transposase RayT